MWIQVDDDKTEALLALASEGDSTPVKYFQERIRHYQAINTEVAVKFRDEAQFQSREGELEVDDEAVVSMAADGVGAYVMAWSFIRNEDVGLPPVGD